MIRDGTGSPGNNGRSSNKSCSDSSSSCRCVSYSGSSAAAAAATTLLLCRCVRVCLVVCSLRVFGSSNYRIFCPGHHVIIIAFIAPAGRRLSGAWREGRPECHAGEAQGRAATAVTATTRLAADDRPISLRSMR